MNLRTRRPEPPPPIVRAIEQFIKLSITKFEPRTLFYKEYLNLINYYPNIQADMGMDETKYQLYEKFRFWEHWFSINRYFYKKGIGFYQGLLKEYIYIKDMGGKTHFSNDYYREKKPNRKIITANIPLAMFRINKARTLGRLVLIVLYLNQYGKNSSEFLDLKGSENFIDDMRGNKFEIINSTEDKGYSIFFNKDFQLDLNAINYPASHQQLLKKLSTYFSFQKVNSPQNP